ncbi:hypothetical protein BLNAU_1131 [Blattamonas nauphoetae]|uniref:MFS general substrate transporter n=1 Tax=Blattamonas nauphoetae TaxID=2049346 RepID=A0ABQ9YJV8_9EUKA|nr:hypothetical protein BLNAU_1131 [Blattamonas nauphoetae]
MSAMSYTTVQINITLTGALVNPLFSALNVGNWIKPLIWLVGPICGLLQPFFGFWNDKAKFKMGKRRPTILLGTILTVVAFVLFFFASIDLIPWRGLRIAIGVVSYFLAHIGLNIQTPASRAIVIEHYIITALLPYPFLFGAGFSLLATIPTLIWAKEIPVCTPPILGPILDTITDTPTAPTATAESGTTHQTEGDPLIQQVDQPFRDNAIVQVARVFKTVWKEHGPVLRACIVYFTSWFGLVLTFPIRLTFVAEVFYNGDPIHSLADYNKGISMGSYAMIIASVVTSLFSMASTRLLRGLDVRVSFCIPHVLAALGSFFLFAFPPSLMTPKTVFIVFIVYPVSYSLIISVIYSIPFSIVAETVPPAQHALYAGVLNVFSVLGQAVALLLNVAVEWFAAKDTKFRHHTQWTWLECGIGFLVVCVHSFLLKPGGRPTANNDGDTHSMEEKEG